MKAGPVQQSQPPQPDFTPALLDRVIKGFTSSWQLRLLVSAPFCLPTLEASASHSVRPGSGLQRNQGSPGIYSTCSPATKKPAPLVTHAACAPWKWGSRLSLLCHSLAVALGKSPRL